MKIIKKYKLWILKNIDSKYLEILNSKYIYLTKIPNNKHAVISDLFPLRIENNWNTFFELLNVPRLINPVQKINNEVEICFFDYNGKLLNVYEKVMLDQIKNTLNLKEIAKKLDITKDGTFAVFHKNDSQKLSSSGSFISDRGYVGYQNINHGPIKGYVHGNFDAVSKKDKLSLLGVSSFFKKHYIIQYEFSPEYKYELFWVNTSNTNKTITLVNLSSSNDKFSINIKPGGVKSYLFKPKDISKLKLISNLNMARPVIFRYMNGSFDVFHG